MKRRPWMPFYPADYLADTSHLTTQQHGAYVLLLLRYWVAGGIPDDDEQLAQITRLPLDVWRSEKPTILAFFRPGLSHKRVDLELAKARAISRVRQKSAKQRHRVKSAESPVSQVASAESPVSPVASAESLVSPVASAESPVSPVASAESLVSPVASAESPVSPVASAEFAKATGISGKKNGQIVASTAQAVDPPNKKGSANAEQLQTQSQSQSQEDSAAAAAAARASPISREAEIFACELARIAGHDPDFLPPSWVSAGPALLVQLWLNQGYRVDTMRAAARAIMARRRGVGPSSPKYFAPIFSEAHAPHLPLRGKPEQVFPHVETTPNSHDWRSRRAAQHAAIDKLAAFAAGGGVATGGQDRDDDLRLVSNA